MKAVVAAFNQEKALVGAFSVITNLRMELFQAPVRRECRSLCRIVTGRNINSAIRRDTAAVTALDTTTK